MKGKKLPVFFFSTVEEKTFCPNFTFRIFSADSAEVVHSISRREICCDLLMTRMAEESRDLQHKRPNSYKLVSLKTDDYFHRTH